MKRNATIAVLLEFVCAGLGHLYSGRVGRALFWFGAILLGYTLVAILVFASGISIVTLMGVVLLTWVVVAASMISAGIVANNASVPFEPKSYNRWLVYVGWFVVVMASTTIASQSLRNYVLESYKFRAGSMLPAIQIGDHIVVNKTISAEKLAAYGTVVSLVFPSETARNYLSEHASAPDCADPSLFEHPGARLVTRVVALAGDTIEVRDGRLHISEEKHGDSRRRRRIVEQNVREGSRPTDPLVFGPYKVPDDHVFVMGDNRSHSSDSRCWGPVPVGNLEGHVAAVWWSFSRKRLAWERFGMSIE